MRRAALIRAALTRSRYSETDYLFVKSLPASLLPSDGSAVGFPFGCALRVRQQRKRDAAAALMRGAACARSYIVPTYPTVAPFAARFYQGPVSDIPPTGNAPVLLTRTDLLKIIPVWADVRRLRKRVMRLRCCHAADSACAQLVAEIEADDDAVEKLGWVRDMYAWSFAAARTGVRHQLLEPPRNPLMVQPPSDTCVACAAMPAATRRVCAFVCVLVRLRAHTHSPCACVQ
jgi:hypothetical protein